MQQIRGGKDARVFKPQRKSLKGSPSAAQLPMSGKEKRPFRVERSSARGGFPWKRARHNRKIPRGISTARKEKGRGGKDALI